MVQDKKIRVKAIQACKTYETDYKFTCPVCGSNATARKNKKVGMVLVLCPGCKRGAGFRL